LLLITRGTLLAQQLRGRRTRLSVSNLPHDLP
jgi:hypothetical protein